MTSSDVFAKQQFSAIFQKLGVTNRAEAVAYAQRKHLLKT